MKHQLHQVTITGLFGAAYAVTQFQQTSVFRAFDAAVHPGHCRQLVLILQSCLLKPARTHAQTLAKDNNGNKKAFCW